MLAVNQSGLRHAQTISGVWKLGDDHRHLQIDSPLRAAGWTVEYHVELDGRVVVQCSLSGNSYRLYRGNGDGWVNH